MMGAIRGWLSRGERVDPSELRRIERIEYEISLLKQGEEKAWHRSMEKIMIDCLDQLKNISASLNLIAKSKE